MAENIKAIGRMESNMVLVPLLMPMVMKDKENGTMEKE